MRPRALVVLLLLARASLAGACPELPVLADAPNPFDLQYGATNVNAALGSGHLTAAFSRCGELTVLKWPGPSYHNQLDYLSSNAPDARRLPHFGALETQGAFPGIAYRLRSGRRGFTWLRDDGWSHVQHYSADTSDVLVDEAVNATLGLRVTAWSFVLPDRDVLVDHYEVRREHGSPVRGGTLIFYTNFAPSLTRPRAARHGLVVRAARPRRAGRPLRGAARARVAGARRHVDLLHQLRPQPHPTSGCASRPGRSCCPTATCWSTITRCGASTGRRCAAAR